MKYNKIICSSLCIVVATLYATANNEDNIIPQAQYEHPTPKLISPKMQQRKGAIRGVRIRFYVNENNDQNVKITLLQAPKGAKLIHAPVTDMIYSHFIQWDVPMDAIEGKSYLFKVKASYIYGKSDTITFPIKVPKTTLIQTTIKNNELIVTDPHSALKGMKLKVHEGSQGDISKVRLRSVAYEDVWKHYSKRLDASKPVEHVVFVIDNMPERVDVKPPHWMDKASKRIKLNLRTRRYRNNAIGSYYWGNQNIGIYDYEDAEGYIYSRNNDTTSQVFILVYQLGEEK